MSETAAKVMISLRKVSKTFDPPPRRRAGKNGKGDSPAAVRYAVKDVDLEVREGELLVLLGGSGSGKTTTLKMINRIIEPSSGSIHIDGKDISTVDPVALRRGIGYVIQGSGLFPHMTIEDNIAVVPKLLGPKQRWTRDAIGRRVTELLGLIGLDPKYRDRFPSELSGGMQQRVGFARAVAAGPRLMLLDEPFGALDPIVRDGVRKAFQKIRDKENLTAVMVTHDMTEALLMADHIVVMHEGQVIQDGSPRELLTQPKTEYVKRLIQGPLEETKQVEKLLAGMQAGGAA